MSGMLNYRCYGRKHFVCAAYVQVDLAVAAEVIAHDDVIDAAFRRISSEIAQYIAAHPTEAETALDLFHAVSRGGRVLFRL